MFNSRYSGQRQGRKAGLFLIVIGVGAIIFFRKLGYSDLVSSAIISGWAENLSADIGLSRDRRSFFNLESHGH